jgi:LuxR family maltose regulon positive regulatory protein
VLTSLLNTKLYFPPLRLSLVPRPRLVERLEKGLSGPLTLISAPAGYGKTTLMSEWRAGVGSVFPIAWFSIDSGDNNPFRFWGYVTTALSGLDGTLTGTVATLLQSPQFPPAEEFITSLINSISGFTKDFALVLDDYHLITAPEIHQYLTYLVEHLPPRMHLVLLTRSDPSLPLARLRARGQLMEIRAEHLRFSVDEAAKLLNQVMGLGLTVEQVAALEKRTEGWVAGLQLAALSMQGREDVQGFVSAFTGSNHYIMDYLAEEVLGRQPEPIRDFLLKTSILERFTGALCDALTGEENGVMLLEALEHTNLFIIPLDNDHHWFRYHQLFADLLRSRLLQSHRGIIPRLHAKASEWFEVTGLLDEAISHALESKDWQRAVILMEKAVPDAYRHDQTWKILSWGKALPTGTLYSNPCLCIFYAWAVVTNGDYADAEEALAVPFPLSLENRGAAIKELVIWVSEARGKEQILRLIGFAQKCLEGAEVAPFTASMLTQCQTYTFWHMGDMKRAAVMAQENIRLGKLGGTTPDQELVSGLMARIQVAMGNLQEAFHINQQILDDPQNTMTPLVFGQALAGQAALYYEWNQLAQASEMIARGLEYCRQNCKYDLQVHFLRLSARLHQSQGNYALAKQALDEAGKVGHEHALPQIWVDLLAAAHVQQMLAEGNLPVAQDWIRQIKNPVGFNLHLYTIPLEGARLALAQGNKAQAASTLSERYKAAKEGGILYAQIEIRALQALAAGNEKEALGFLSEALRWAEPQGFVRVFLDQGPAMVPLLQQARLTNITPDYTARLLAAFSTVSGGTPARWRAKTKQILSDREVELLKLIAAGRSNKEIASELVISIGTVKRHTVNIYNKLVVKSRTEAVAKARESGLL